MSQPEHQETPSRISQTMAEAVVSLFFVLIGAIVAIDSRRIGAGWADDGPQAGYFPFYIGCALALAGLVTLVQAVREGMATGKQAFASREQLARIGQVFVPTCLYVGLIYLIGIYVASALFIGYFMRRHGVFGWVTLGLTAIGVPLSLFILFERWFLVSLPKGPIERMLGF